jgi:hypothetical protein
MKQRNRKRFDAAFKARVALEAAQEKESLAQLGKRYGVHPARVGVSTSDSESFLKMARCSRELTTPYSGAHTSARPLNTCVSMGLKPSDRPEPTRPRATGAACQSGPCGPRLACPPSPHSEYP